MMIKSPTIFFFIITMQATTNIQKRNIIPIMQKHVKVIGRDRDREVRLLACFLWPLSHSRKYILIYPICHSHILYKKTMFIIENPTATL
jgi:hypothetical protein